MKPERVTALYSALRAANPEPRSELEFSTPFELLIAVILSAQATDKSVDFRSDNKPRHWLTQMAGK